MRLTAKQLAFLRWANRAAGHGANKPFEATTAASLRRRGLVEVVRVGVLGAIRYGVTDAGRQALKEIDE